MKRFCLLVVGVLMASLSFAQSSDWQNGFFYDPASKAVSIGVGKQVGKLTDVLGRKGLSLDLVSYVATPTSNGAPTFGYAALARARVARELDVFAGPGLTFGVDQKPSVQLAVFFSIRF